MKKTIVALPCYNEEKTILKVIKDFQQALPQAQIIVFDNNSTDNSLSIVRQLGIKIFPVESPGKGHVVRAMFENLREADALLVVDSDDTYFAKEASQLIDLVYHHGIDMAVGNRLTKVDQHSLTQLRQAGNQLIIKIINGLFKSDFQDVLSGYRVFSQRFLRNVHLESEGFEIETELTIKAFQMGMKIKEIPISYQGRPQDSKSKLSPLKDGLRIMNAVLQLRRKSNCVSK